MCRGVNGKMVYFKRKACCSDSLWMKLSLLFWVAVLTAPSVCFGPEGGGGSGAIVRGLTSASNSWRSNTDVCLSNACNVLCRAWICSTNFQYIEMSSSSWFLAFLSVSLEWLIVSQELYKLAGEDTEWGAWWGMCEGVTWERVVVVHFLRRPISRLSTLNLFGSLSATAMALSSSPNYHPTILLPYITAWVFPPGTNLAYWISSELDDGKGHSPMEKIARTCHSMLERLRSRFLVALPRSLRVAGSFSHCPYPARTFLTCTSMLRFSYLLFRVEYLICSSACCIYDRQVCEI